MKTLIVIRIFTLIVFFTLSSSQLMSQVLWIEGEDATSVPEGLEKKTSNKFPASDGKALIGKAFSQEGNKIAYAITLPVAINNAYMTMRYSRLHIRDWTAADLNITVTGAPKQIMVHDTIDQTGGWGTTDGKEWGLHSVKLGDFPAGKINIEFTVMKKNSDLNLDGFFISSGILPFTSEDIAECQSVQISNQGVIGLHVANTAIDQKDFQSIEIIGKSFSPSKIKLSAELYDENGNVHTTVFKNKQINLSNQRSIIEISPKDLPNLTDGAYVLNVRWEDVNRSVSSSLVAMGDLLVLASAKADEYESYVANMDKLDQQVVKRVKGDFVYAIEYIRNSLILLKSNEGQFDTDDSPHKKAMAYFEDSKTRTALVFSQDLRNIIKQTNETIERLNKGKDPYKSRSGDLRRAFYSDFSGQLEPYRLLIPENYWKSTDYKCLLALHGGGGDENYFPENEGFAETAYKFEYFIVSPRANLKYRNGGEKDMKQLVELMEAEYPAINPEKLYCTGVSMGAGGTYRMAVAYPDLFKAVAIVSGGLREDADTEEVDKLGSTAVLIMHGKLDGVIPVENAYRLADELKKRNYNYEIEVYPTHGHAYYGKQYLERTNDFFQKNQ